MHNSRLTRWASVIFIPLFVLGLAACGPKNGTPARKSESAIGRDSYQKEVAATPAHSCAGQCPTRKTINAWVDTWKVPGQLAFTYLTDAGVPTRYFVTNGPPVSMCAALTPTWTYETRDLGSDSGDVKVPAASLDGVYYSGGQCLSYYGTDASTGQYIEFSIGGSQNYFLSTQPLPVNVPAAGPTDVSEVACAKPAAPDTPACHVK